MTTTKQAGRKGGKAAAANLTPAQRSARAKNAVEIRERKRREKRGATTPLSEKI